jgi:regulator of RNase E activity RraA
MADRKLTGKISPSLIGSITLPPLPDGLVAGFRALGPDLTSLVSDVLDEMGAARVVPASVLKPMYPGAAVVGRALTLRNIAQGTSPFKGATDRVSRLAEVEAHNLAEDGDVLVFEGVDGVSNMGGVSASIGKRQGELGAIVDGGARDVSECREIGYPIWSRSVSPLTGKWRIQTVAINQIVMVGGVQVVPGDVVIADDTGICFVPADLAPSVLERAREIHTAEAARYRDIAAGVSVVDLANRAGSFTMPAQE